MVSVLVIGYAPDATDFTDPALPPGMTAAKVAEGLRADARRMHELGWHAEHLPIRPDEDVRSRVLNHLSGRSYDCIVIGGGVRMTTKHVPVCEQVVNAVREGAPRTPIAFNAGPDTSNEAAMRWRASATS